MKHINGILIAFVILLITSCNSRGQTSKSDKFGDISVKEAREMITENKDNDQFVILDTRTPGEYDKGHLKDAVFFNFSSKEFYKRISALDRNTTYLIYCHSGGRSRMTMNFMKKNGFKSAYNVSGGIVSWGREGYEIIRDKK